MSVCRDIVMDITEKRMRINHEALRRNLSPVTCDRVFLPWWGSNFGLPFFNPEWNEVTGREVVLKFRLIHKIRGTLAGLKKIMKLFRVSVVVQEWFEEGYQWEEGIDSGDILSAPYTFKVDVYINDNDWGVGLRAEKQIREIIDWVSPESRLYKLSVKYRIRPRVVILPVMRSMVSARFSGDFRNVR